MGRRVTHMCQHLDDNGKRCRREGKKDEVFSNPDHQSDNRPLWFVVYTCELHRTTEAERKP